MVSMQSVHQSNSCSRVGEALGAYQAEGQSQGLDLKKLIEMMIMLQMLKMMEQMTQSMQ